MRYETSRTNPISRTAFTFGIVALLLLPAIAPVFDQGKIIDARYKDHLLSFEQGVDILVSLMTLEEKVSQMMSRTPHDLSRFDIPGYEWSGLARACP